MPDSYLVFLRYHFNNFFIALLMNSLRLKLDLGYLQGEKYSETIGSFSQKHQNSILWNVLNK